MFTPDERLRPWLCSRQSADGSGKGKAVQFATLVGVSKLSAADFEVV